MIIIVNIYVRIAVLLTEFRALVARPSREENILNGTRGHVNINAPTWRVAAASVVDVCCCVRCCVCMCVIHMRRVYTYIINTISRPQLCEWNAGVAPEEPDQKSQRNLSRRTPNPYPFNSPYHQD